jgi:hypothetical protein
VSFIADRETKMPDLVPTLKRGLINTLRLRRESLREANSGLLRIADFEVRGIPPMRDEAAHGWGTHGSVLPRESEVEFAVSHSCAKDAHEWGTLLCLDQNLRSSSWYPRSQKRDQGHPLSLVN